MDISDHLTTRQVEDLLRVDRVTIYRMLQDGRLKGNKIGSQWRFLRADVERLLRGEPQISHSASTGNNIPMSVACLQAIQNLFSTMSHLSAMLLNMQGELITQISGPNPVCQLILSSSNGWDACLESWQGFVEQSRQGLDRFTCHAGLHYLGAPIKDKGAQKALFVIGPFYWQPPDSHEETQRIHRLSEYHQLPYQSLAEAAHTVPVIQSEQQPQVKAWLEAVVEAMENVVQERSVFVERLQQIASLSQVP